MSERYQVDPARPDASAAAIEAAARAVAGGHLVVFPTETVYGIAAAPDRAGATEKLFLAKRRRSSLALPVLVPTAPVAWELAVPTEAAERLTERFWPGPLTLVLERRGPSLGWELGDQERSIGVRVPDHPLTAALLRRAGPLATTSANVSGLPPLGEPELLVAAFGEAVAVYLFSGFGSNTAGGRPSTVVDMRGSEPVFLRSGAIDPASVRGELGLPGPEAQSVHSTRRGHDPDRLHR